MCGCYGNRSHRRAAGYADNGSGYACRRLGSSQKSDERAGRQAAGVSNKSGGRFCAPGWVIGPYHTLSGEEERYTDDEEREDTNLDRRRPPSMHREQQQSRPCQRGRQVVVVVASSALTDRRRGR
eukprot:GHVU01130081.1.p1 GENE.GHVU01130081.1~~GHVU01130081.1.p1  ORF type:complete len:125 (-),score=10.23 GHVU01130081.1:140-514(-)